MTRIQEEGYRAILSSPAVRGVLLNLDSGNSYLALICKLRKLCNSPSLVKDDQDEEESQSPIELPSLQVGKLMVTFDQFFYQQDIEAKSQRMAFESVSGKVAVLSQLLKKLHPSGQKIVVVSNFTKTLDLLETLIKRDEYTFCRLDGKTSLNKRQDIVDSFNSLHSKTCNLILHLYFLKESN